MRDQKIHRGGAEGAKERGEEVGGWSGMKQWRQSGGGECEGGLPLGFEVEVLN
jgi:hypothetical protein